MEKQCNYNYCNHCCSRCRKMISEITRIVEELIPDPTPTPTPTNTNFGYVAQYLNGGGVNVPAWGTIPFDTIVSDNPNISHANGVFTILESGNYYISWILGPADVGTTPEIAISLIVNDLQHIWITSPLITNTVASTIVGSTYLQVTDVPTTMYLTNVGPGNIALRNSIATTTINILKF